MKPTTELIDLWIAEQQAAGKSRDEIAGTVLISGDSVIKVKKSGKTKYSLDITVGCTNLQVWGRGK